MIGSDGETISTTYRDYDLSQIKVQLNQIVMGVGIMAFLHFKFGYVRPVVIQTVLGLKNIMNTQLFKVYVRGLPAVGDLARPWKAPNPFG